MVRNDGTIQLSVVCRSAQDVILTGSPSYRVYFGKDPFEGILLTPARKGRILELFMAHILLSRLKWT